MTTPAETDAQQQKSPTHSSSFFEGVTGKVYALLGLVLIIVIGAYYVGSIDTECMGFTHDDGVYAIAGKALAQGKGFKLLHVIGEPGQIKYPFIYPLILAAVWLFNPHYPENLAAMLYATIAFTLGGCWLVFVWLKQCQKLPGWLALLITAIIPANFFFIYFFSAVMSEAPYLFLSMLTLWIFHQKSQTEKKLTGQTILILVLLSALTFLTRVLGLSLMAAIGVWLLLNRQWKNALLYGIGSFLLGILPWALWIKFNTPALNVYNYPLVNTYSNYGLEFLHNFTTGNYFNGIGMATFSLINKMQEVMLPILPNFLKIYPKLKNNPDVVTWVSLGSLTTAYLLFGYYVLQVIRTLMRSWKNGRFQAERYSVPALYLFFYIVIITFWNYEDQMARFLTPVLPILWLYFFKPMAHLLPDFGKALPTSRWANWKIALATLTTLIVCTAGLWAVSNAYKVIYISRHQHWIESGKYRWLWNEYKGVFRWINNNLPKDAKLSVASDTVFYLYTERPTFYTYYASLRRKNGKFTEDSIPLLMKSMDHYGVNYLVAEPHMQARVILAPVNKVAKQLLDKYPKRFQLIHTSERTAIKVYKILPLEPGQE